MAVNTEKRPKKIKKEIRFVLKEFELFANIGGYSKGTVISLRCDKKTKVPIERYWRNRLKDAIIDNCMAEVKVKKTKKE